MLMMSLRNFLITNYTWEKPNFGQMKCCSYSRVYKIQLFIMDLNGRDTRSMVNKNFYLKC